MVVIESPRLPCADESAAYAALATLALYGQAKAAYAAVLHYPSFLDDSTAVQRLMGLEVGRAIGEKANEAAFFIDLGWSAHMHEAYARHKHDKRYTQACSLQAVFDGVSWVTTHEAWKQALKYAAYPSFLLKQLGIRVETAPIVIDEGYVN